MLGSLDQEDVMGESAEGGGDEEDFEPPKFSSSLTAPFEHPREWLFLVENRLVIAAILFAVVLGIFFAVELLTSFEEQGLQPLFYVFGSMIGGNFTLVTIVISISQLVISQQLGAPGDLRERIEETNQYREAVEDEMDHDVAPVTPTDFLQMLLEQTAAKVETVNEDLSNGDPDDEDRSELDELMDGLQTHINHVNTLLNRSEVGLFEALSVTLQTNYSWEIYEIRRVRNNIEGETSEELGEALDDLVVRLQQIDVARQYLKTLYMQDELAKMSRLLLYTGTPAVVVSIFMMHQFAASTRVILTAEMLSAIVPLALAIGVAPLAVLVAFVLRITTVAQRTVAITPFTTPSQEMGVTSDSRSEAEQAEGEQVSVGESD